LVAGAHLGIVTEARDVPARSSHACNQGLRIVLRAHRHFTRCGPGTSRAPSLANSGFLVAVARYALAAALLSAHVVQGASTPVLTVNGVNADYTTTHLFVDEVAGDSLPLTISFTPNTNNVVAADVFSNLNRRNRAVLDANGDGVEDGILAPNGNQLASGDDSSYYKPYPMTSLGGGQYSLTLYATNCGVYRLTARYKVTGDTNWYWYSSDGAFWRGNTSGRRDHAVIVSPVKARSLVLYEVNAMIVDALGTQTAQRSTLTDLYDGPGARPYNPVSNRFNLTYVTNLGVNWLWLQPVHPIGIEASVNSPYSVKNYFEIAPLLSKANTRAAGRQEFLGLVAAADAAGVNIMMDVPFNHTAHDAELGNSGVSYFNAPGNPGNWQPTDEIRQREPRFYSRTNNYSLRANSAANIALAPDRGDFGKWSDVYDVFFGNYSCLVAQNPLNNNDYLNQADTFDYTTNTGSFDLVTQNVWRYYSDILLYWLDQTGCTNGTPANRTTVGVDGIRADFAEGLPPQAWEYIINKTRTRKWDFVFLAESLGPQNVTFRSSRHFDVVYDSVLYDFRNAATVTDYRNLFNARRTAYGQCLMVWNTASHDVGGYYADPFQALLRYLVGATIDGAPMIFYGQELGTRQGFGFSVYQANSEQTPNFLSLNSLQPICAPANRTYDLDQLYLVYAAANRARQLSPALRSSNRYFLDPIGSAQPSMFAVAKYETPATSPKLADVVFAFINLDPTNSHQSSFNVNITQGGSNLFGITSNRIYNVKNIAADTAIDPTRANVWQWNGGIAGSNLLAFGIWVYVNPVPASAVAWGSSPFEAQDLKLFDVTPPPMPLAPAAPKPYAIGNVASFTWPAVVDSQGGIASYHVRVGTTPGGSNVVDTLVANTTVYATNSFGQTLYAFVSAINDAGIEGPASAVSPGVLLLAPGADQDGDGMSNLAEDIAGTNPLDANSVLRISAFANGNLLTWSSVAQKTYQILATTDLSQDLAPISGVITATGPSTVYLDVAATNLSKFYRVKVIP
jgi:glycosidase